MTRTVAEVEEQREEDEREGEKDEEEHAEGRRQSEEQDEGAGGGGRKDPEQSGTVDELTGRVGDHAEVTAGILIGRGKRMKSGRRECPRKRKEPDTQPNHLLLHIGDPELVDEHPLALRVQLHPDGVVALVQHHQCHLPKAQNGRVGHPDTHRLQVVHHPEPLIGQIVD